MKRRNVLGLLLAAVLTVTCIPTVAFADEGEKASGSALVEESYVIETETVEQEEPESTDSITEDAAVEGEDTTIETEEAPVMLMSEIEEDGINTYKVYLPSDYDESKSYPTVYLMPYDGYDSDIYVNDGIQARLDELMAGNDVLSMVVVMPDFDEDDDYSTLLNAIVADVEGKYAVIKDAKYRAILGVNVGGYMAMETALVSKSDSFFAAGSHMGDFTSDTNPYLTKGSVYDAVTDLENETDKGYATLQKHYIYIDGPNEDASTTVVGGTSDIGGDLQKRTNPMYKYGASVTSTPDISMVEFAVLDGSKNEEFYLNSLGRSLNRFSLRFAEDLFTGSLSSSVNTIDSSVDQVEITLSYEFSDAIAQMCGTFEGAKLTVNVGSFTDAVTVTDLKGIWKSTVDKEYLSDGNSTEVTANVELLGLTLEIDGISLVNKQEVGTADDEQVVDLMGDWYFQAYTDSETSKNSLAYAQENYKSWNTVQPGLGWWTATFDSSLTGENHVGSAWYVKEFELPEEFTATENIVMAVGCFDEANEVYVNGQYVGSTGMEYPVEGELGVYDGSNPWDTNCAYNIDSSVLKYHGEGTNTIAIRMYNSSGGGGWYEGPIGVYSRAAYNKTLDKPSDYADEAATEKVLEVVETQIKAIEAGEIDSYKITVSPDYFEDGYNKEDVVNVVNEWLEKYEKVEVQDSPMGVFVDGDSYVYQANRIVKGYDADNKETVIMSEEISEYFADINGEMKLYGSHSRFFVDKEEVYVASRWGNASFYVYLPEGYFDTDNVDRYPTLYLLHGIGSQGSAFAIDEIDKIADGAIPEEMRETIMVIPNEPWQAYYGWDTGMIKQIIDLVDSKYRTIDDAKYRSIAGCSMGGGGAFNIGLSNSDLFSGVISFYGAISNHDKVLNEMSAEYLSQYAIFMVCGNEDMWDFYIDQEEMSRILSDKGVEHYHLVDQGRHDSAFYVPRFLQAVKYIESKAYTTGGTADDAVAGTTTVEEKENVISVTYNINAAEVMNTYGLAQIPVQVRVLQDGVVVVDVTEYKDATQLTNSIDISTAEFDVTKEYTVEVYVSVLEDTKLVASQVMHEEIVNPETPEDPTVPVTPEKGEKPSTDKNDTVDTGDHAPIALYLGLALTALVAMAAAIKLRRRA